MLDDEIGEAHEAGRRGKKKAGLRRGDESIGISTIKGGPLGKS